MNNIFGFDVIPCNSRKNKRNYHKSPQQLNSTTINNGFVEFNKRNCFVRHFSVPFEGLIIDADTWFSATAYINKNKKRIMGFYTGPDDTGDGIDRFIEYVNQGVK